ncbi:hypothetical protein EGT29_22290 [Pigmentiphaga sp. H8]|nr:hypothetical protein EGT29_22290 [Pigmentiphaga sp. H8]
MLADGRADGDGRAAGLLDRIQFFFQRLGRSRRGRGPGQVGLRAAGPAEGGRRQGGGGFEADHRVGNGAGGGRRDGTRRRRRYRGDERCLHGRDSRSARTEERPARAPRWTRRALPGRARPAPRAPARQRRVRRLRVPPRRRRRAR